MHIEDIYNCANEEMICVDQEELVDFRAGRMFLVLQKSADGDNGWVKGVGRVEEWMSGGVDEWMSG